MSEHAICNLSETPVGHYHRHPGLNLEWSVDLKNRLVTVRFGKRLTIELIKHYAEGLRSDSSFEATFSEIVDLQLTEELELQPEDFLKLADKVDPFSPQAKRAFVVRSSGQSHAVRIHKILRIHKNIEIFDSLEEAQRWVTGKSAARDRPR